MEVELKLTSLSDRTVGEAFLKVFKVVLTAKDVISCEHCQVLWLATFMC